MNSGEIIRKLINGSKAIDRMKEEINYVVKMVMGLVINYKVSTDRQWQTPPKEQKESRRIIFHETLTDFPNHENYKWWVIFFYTPKSTIPQWEVRCVLRSTLVYSNHPGMTSLRLKHTKNVHESLPVFVEEMSKKFPFLKESWQPILDVAGE